MKEEDIVCSNCKYYNSYDDGDGYWDIWCDKTLNMDFWDHEIAKKCKFFEFNNNTEV